MPSLGDVNRATGSCRLAAFSTFQSGACMPAHFTRTRVRHLAIVGFAALLGAVGIAQQVQTVSTMAFLEGPTSDKEGNVYFVEMVTPRIMKVDKNGVTTTFR